jgi:hypothetical protein
MNRHGPTAGLIRETRRAYGDDSGVGCWVQDIKSWRRCNAQLVWQAMQAVLAVVGCWKIATEDPQGAEGMKPTALAAAGWRP